MPEIDSAHDYKNSDGQGHRAAVRQQMNRGTDPKDRLRLGLEMIANHMEQMIPEKLTPEQQLAEVNKFRAGIHEFSEYVFTKPKK